jgi:hypothetical protein
MIARVTMELATRKPFEAAVIDLFLPVELGEATEYGVPVLFKPESLTGIWPAIYGIWDGRDVYATISYDEVGVQCDLIWSDGDRGTMDLTNGMSLIVGRLLTFDSEMDKVKYTLRVTHVKVL